MQNTLFVTGFFDLEEDRSKDKSVETCFGYFNELARTKIRIHLFLSPSYKDIYASICGDNTNVTITYMDLKDMKIYKALEGLSVKLPSVRTEHHDTRAFLTLMNSKVELVHTAMQIFSGYVSYAWIDFSIFHVLKEKESSSKFLHMLAHTRFQDSSLFIPGCLQRNDNSIFEAVNWRFCGGFFLGSPAAIQEIYSLYETHFRTIVIQDGLTWEVNMWAYFEKEFGWKPQWYPADHNDTIIRIPSTYIKVVASLTTIPSRLDTLQSTIDSLLVQVDHVYISVPREYKRFSEKWTSPPYMLTEPYISSVTIISCDDFGPATKYIGVHSKAPSNTWVFVCDDDQEYHPTLLSRMKESFHELAVYQNRYESIRMDTSGGMIHGFVGLCINTHSLSHIHTMELPECAYFVDDQWMSIYCFKNTIPIFSTHINEYVDIFKVLYNNHEKIGADSLGGLNNRVNMVQAIEKYFNVSIVNKPDVTACK